MPVSYTHLDVYKRQATYEPPLDTIEAYDSFYQEIIRATTDFLNKMNGINPELMKTQYFVFLSKYLHDLEHKW